MIKLKNLVKNFIIIRIDGDKMIFHNNWLSNSLTDSIYSKQEETDEVKQNFDYRRKYSNEGYNVVIDNLYNEDVIIQDHSNPINESRTDRKLHLSIDTHAVKGSKILWNEDIWLIVSSIKNVGEAYKTTQIQQCNYTLPYQLGTSMIIQEPCIVEDTQTTIGQDEGNIITVPDNMKRILVQYNSNTSQLKEGKRLFIDRVCDNPSVYEITKINRITYMDGDNGLIEFTLKAGSIDKTTDRPDLLIANYKSEDATIPTVNSATITSSDDKFTIKISGYQKEFDVVYKDSDGNILSDIESIWNCVLPSGYESEFTFTTDNDKCYLTASRNIDLIGKIIKLSVSSQDGKYTDEKDIKVVGII